MKSEAYLTKRLVNLLLVTGELGTFCQSCPPSLDLSNPKLERIQLKVARLLLAPNNGHDLRGSALL